MLMHLREGGRERETSAVAIRGVRGRYASADGRRKRHPVVRRPPDVVPRVLLYEESDPYGDEEPKGERMVAEGEGRDDLCADDDRVLERVHHAARPREWCHVGVVP